jgi:hypothetical protein
MWQLFEPLHALTYFASESIEEYKSAGLKGFWMGYFAGRSAPMGAVGPAVVTATFYNFSPAMAARALPDAWTFSSPERVLETRLVGMDRALRRVLLPEISTLRVTWAADLARQACEELDVGGRPLGAANVGLPWPDEPHLALWHATTILREHRGDGHVVALVAAELDGCQALVSMAATGAVPREVLQTSRGWDDDVWEGAVEALRGRGWLDHDGALTPTGRAARQEIEDMTDRLAAEPWWRLGDDGTEELATLLRPLVKQIAAAGEIRIPNPIGLPLPDTHR